MYNRNLFTIVTGKCIKSIFMYKQKYSTQIVGTLFEKNSIATKVNIKKKKNQN